MSGGSRSDRRRELLQLRFYFGERDRAGDRPLEAAVMDACARRGVEAAALLRGAEGFGARHRLRTDRLLSLSEDAPLVAVAVGDGARVEGLAEEVRALAGKGLIVLEDVEGWGPGGATTGTATTSAAMAAAPVVADGGGVEGSAGGAPGSVRGPVKATIWGPRSGVASPHVAAVAALRRRGADAATVLLGVDGVLDGARRRARFVAGNRSVPAITVAISEHDTIEAALADLKVVPSLVTLEPVVGRWRIPPPSHHTTGGVERSSVMDRLSHHGTPGIRVTLVTSEGATHDGRPRYLALIDALREEGAAGATALRGVWGFRGGREPHGDRVLALRRDVPLLVEAVDTAERAERWRQLAADLIDEDDVLHEERVACGIPLGQVVPNSGEERQD